VTHVDGRLFASDLPHDGRWPHFVTTAQLDALLALLSGDDYDPDLAHAALERPQEGKTQNAKRLYWLWPENHLMIRISKGERHALKTMLAGIAVDELRRTEEMRGVRLHLQSQAKKARRAMREAS
jgi:hypothetical protein